MVKWAQLLVHNHRYARNVSIFLWFSSIPSLNPILPGCWTHNSLANWSFPFQRIISKLAGHRTEILGLPLWTSLSIVYLASTIMSIFPICLNSLGTWLSPQLVAKDWKAVNHCFFHAIARTYTSLCSVRRSEASSAQTSLVKCLLSDPTNVFWVLLLFQHSSGRERAWHPSLWTPPSPVYIMIPLPLQSISPPHQRKVFLSLEKGFPNLRAIHILDQIIICCEKLSCAL